MSKIIKAQCSKRKLNTIKSYFTKNQPPAASVSEPNPILKKRHLDKSNAESNDNPLKSLLPISSKDIGLHINKIVSFPSVFC